MESSIAEFLSRQFAFGQLPTASMAFNQAQDTRLRDYRHVWQQGLPPAALSTLGPKNPGKEGWLKTETLGIVKFDTFAIRERSATTPSLRKGQ